jgi:hypothetical protein
MSLRQHVVIGSSGGDVAPEKGGIRFVIAPSAFFDLFCVYSLRWSPTSSIVVVVVCTDNV